jgi:hypothetical protein
MCGVPQPDAARASLPGVAAGGGTGTTAAAAAAGGAEGRKQAPTPVCTTLQTLQRAKCEDKRKVSRVWGQHRVLPAVQTLTAGPWPA